MGTMSVRPWLVVAIAALALGGMAACGGEDEDGGAAGTTSAATTAGGGEEVGAGLVSDVGRFNDRSFNQSALEGLNRARDELGARVRAVESRAAGDYVPNLSTLARQRYDVTIGVGFLLGGIGETTSETRPGQNSAGRPGPSLKKSHTIRYSASHTPITAEKLITKA